MASVLFLLFGLWMLFYSALGWHTAGIVITGGVAAAACIAGIVTAIRRRRRAPLGTAAGRDGRIEPDNAPETA